MDQPWDDFGICIADADNELQGDRLEELVRDLTEVLGGSVTVTSDGTDLGIGASCGAILLWVVGALWLTFANGVTIEKNLDSWGRLAQRFRAWVRSKRALVSQSAAAPLILATIIDEVGNPKSVRFLGLHSVQVHNPSLPRGPQPFRANPSRLYIGVVVVDGNTHVVGLKSNGIVLFTSRADTSNPWAF